MGLVTGVVLPNNGDRIKVENYNDPINKIIAQVNGNLDGDNIASVPATKITGDIPGSALADSAYRGWKDLAVTPTLSATNGQNSFDLQFAGVNYTDRLSRGMRLRVVRQTTPQTQVPSLNGTNQYFSKATPAGMTFTDDFAAGAWIYLPAYNPGSIQVIESRYNGTSGWVFYLETDGRVSLGGLNAGAANISKVTSYQSVPLNRWVYVSAQLDMSAFTATSTTSYVMIDGVDVPAQVVRGGTNPTALIQAGNYEVGSWNGGLAPFGGRIAQPWVSSAKVTQANVRGFMYAGITSAVITANSIVSAYSGDGNMTDLNTTNANNLAAQNAAGYITASPFNANAYAIIMTDPTYSGGNTTMTVSTANGYSIPNATLGTTSYSTNGVPYGFPKDADKWSILGVWKAANANVAAAGTLSWQPIPGMTITEPAGVWRRNYSVLGYAARGAAGNLQFFATLAEASGVETYSLITNGVYTTGLTEYGAMMAKNMVVSSNSSKTLWLNLKPNIAGMSAVAILAGQGTGDNVIELQNALL